MTTAVPSHAHVARARRAPALALVLCLGAAACLDDSPVAPANGAVQLEIRAQIAPGPGERAVAIHVYYLRQNEDRVDLPATPSQVNVPRGGTATRAVTVEIAECLADPLRMTGESGTGCRFFIELRLLDADGEFISEQTQEAEASAPGQQVPVEPFNLPQASVGASSSTVSFAATEHDEGHPAAKTITVFSSTGAELGELSAEVMYPDEGELPAWLDVSLDGGILTLRPSTTSLFPRTYTATVRVSASRADVAVKDILVTYVVAGLPRRLVVSGDGQGAATVVSSPEGIDCLLIFGRTNSGCVEDFPFGTVVTLSITADEGSFFGGWGGACSGTGACVVTMDDDLQVVANFTPLGGGDFVLIGDSNPFDATALNNNPDNRRLALNLVGFANAGVRSSGTTIQMDCGRQSPLGPTCSQFNGFVNLLTDAGYEVTHTTSARGTLTSIPAGVKLLVFVIPCEAFDTSELIALREFARDGGRILLISEFQDFFDFFGEGFWKTCSSAQNQLASGLGTDIRIQGGTYDSGYTLLPGSVLRPHQLTAGMTSVTVAASTAVSADTSAHALFYDSSNEVLLAAADEVDTSPLPVALIPNIDARLSIGGGGTSTLLKWTNLPPTSGR